MIRVEREDLGALALGCALLGSGGGGATTQLELLAAGGAWPVDVHAVDAVDPATPCLAVALAGSTMVMTERLPGTDRLSAAVAAAERWLGCEVPAVCTLEIGGLNGLTALVAAGGRAVVDADCMGRALPGIDQVSLLVDGLPGLVVATTTGDGVGVVDRPRPADAEAVVRAALRLSGGTGAVVVAGFTVGDLAEHAVVGTTSRALSLGRGFLAARESAIGELAAAVGGRLLAQGRIQAVLTDPVDPQVQAFDLVDPGGAVHRLVTRTETLALMTDGVLVSAAPTVLAVLDVRTRAVLQISDLSPAHHIAVVELAAPTWWTARPDRLRRVTPAAYGVADLEPDLAR
ncbi:S-methyl thiohydantoin desulfurase domain-containing protein [Nakamurella endophytica]|uniref:DUF917 domain-containing protein n=1 Tax=Nakamurella endophytica TaxID=1748367 RepID=A0A917SZ47_9ACTN|nr:DUF917 family protein [Nakamurella endophytica]GGM04513.1 hypothetical protein GCM10011594_25930 [Nakamurella endophytica]